MPPPSRIHGMTVTAASRSAKSSGYGARPLSSYNGSHSVSQHQRVTSQQESDDDSTDYTGRRKGMPKPSSSPCRITYRKHRTRGCFSKSYPLPNKARSQHHGSFSASYVHELDADEEEDQKNNGVSMGKNTEEAMVDDIGDSMAGMCLKKNWSQRNRHGTMDDKEKMKRDRTRTQASPSKLPKLASSHPSTPCTPAPVQQNPGCTRSRLSRKMPMEATTVFFATKSSLIPFTAWDTSGRLRDMVRSACKA